MRKILFISVILAVGALLFIPVSRAQTNCLGTKVCNGLISTTDLYGDFDSSTGDSLVSPRAAFLSHKIPNYNDLFTEYYTLSKAIKFSYTDQSTNQRFLDFREGSTPETSRIFYAENDLEISGNPTPSDVKGPGVVFVGKTLKFSDNYTYGNAASDGKAAGTVFVVKGNVVIESNVTKVDAVIIAEGKIYTAGLGCSRSSVTAEKLEIKGSLISLDKSNLIAFCRTLSGTRNNTSAAEVITQQPKYLSIMRNVFASTLERWSEI